MASKYIRGNWIGSPATSLSEASWGQVYQGELDRFPSAKEFQHEAGASISGGIG